MNNKVSRERQDFGISCKQYLIVGTRGQVRIIEEKKLIDVQWWISIDQMDFSPSPLEGVFHLLASSYTLWYLLNDSGAKHFRLNRRRLHLHLPRSYVRFLCWDRGIPGRAPCMYTICDSNLILTKFIFQKYN